jgi:hypothetical protein
VRPGFEVAKHQLNGKSALVVTVHAKKTGLSKKGLPRENRAAGVIIESTEIANYSRRSSFTPIFLSDWYQRAKAFAPKAAAALPKRTSRARKRDSEATGESSRKTDEKWAGTTVRSEPVKAGKSTVP